MSTIFSKIIRREIPATVVYEDDLCLAFKDVHPQAPTHILIIPKQEIRSLQTVTPEHKALMGHLIWAASEVARQLGVAESGYRLVTNAGAGAGQSVFHLHFHLLAGREMTWPPG